MADGVLGELEKHKRFSNDLAAHVVEVDAGDG